ncbi:hypothetical protein [Roseobacter sp. HKCCD7870]|uniref:hypothetical protein n=1 Tax=Roseobacter sp. HKCCD7870 TaxID=3120343 RepID=UPI0030EC8CC9
MSRAKGLTGLLKCRFDHGLEAMQAQFEILNLSGSDLPALNAPGARVKSGVFLSDKFHAKGKVSLSGAEIGGQLNCEDGRFENPKGDALNAQGAQVRDGLFFRNVEVTGGFVDLSSAHVGTLCDDLI